MGVAMVVGLGLGFSRALAVDTMWLWPPPVELGGNVEGARVLLGSVTAGLITVAVFGLWMRTVVVGLMASHFSPRTLLTFLDDRFQRNLLAFMATGVMAVLVILLRMPSDGEAAAPMVSTALVVLIALASLAGVLLAIQHATRSLSLPQLVSRLADDALRVLERYPVTRLELTEVPPLCPQRRQSWPRALAGLSASTLTGCARRCRPAAASSTCAAGSACFTHRSPVALVSLAQADEGEEADLDTIARAVTLARTRSP